MKDLLSDIKDEFFEKKKSYHPPLPRKRQRTSSYKYQQPGKCKVYTEEEIFLFKLKNFKRRT